MNLTDWRRLRALFLLVHLVMVCAAFAIHPWVQTDEASWGLWTACYDNLTAVGITEGYDNGCDGITFGDGTPGYFQTVRGLAIAVLILSILQLGVLLEDSWCGRGKVPVLFAFVCAFILAVMVGVATTNGVSEDEWHGQNGQLSTGFYLSIACIVTSLILMFCNYHLDQHRIIVAEDERKTREAAERAKKAREAAEKAKKIREEAENAKKVREEAEKAKKTKEAAEKARKIKQAEEKAKKEEAERKKRREEEKRASSAAKKNSVAPAPAAAASSTSYAHDRQGGHLVALHDVHRSHASAVSPSSPPSPPPLLRRHVGNDESYEPLKLVSSDESTDSGSSYEHMNMFLADHSQMHNLDGIPKDDLYCEDLRSASRASMLRERAMQERGPSGELPLLDTMPTYTLPPSGAHKIPRQPPPSYEAALRDYLDMPPPPVVSVPISDRQQY